MIIILKELAARVRLKNQSGTTRDGEPYIRVYLKRGVLQPGEQISQRFELTGGGKKPPTYEIALLSGQGNP